MKILLATSNEHKIKELSEILHDTCKNKKISLLTLKDFPGFVMPQETGITIKANAVIKAIAAAKFSGIAALADDTGLAVRALNGAPGVRSARYAGKDSTAEENNRKLLAELDGLFLGQRDAVFKTVACLAQPDESYKIEEGTLEGYIGFGYRGKNGFGYDPLFIVKGKNKTLAELNDKEKNAISHRKKAFEKILL